jgi:hypothetical protein
LFTNAFVTITVDSDTTTAVQHVPYSSTFVNENVGTATIDVAGLPLATLTDVIAAFDYTTVGLGGIRDLTLSGADLLDTNSVALLNFNLMTSLGPLTGSAGLNPGFAFPTSQGAFFFRSAGDSTFQATITPQVGAVP